MADPITITVSSATVLLVAERLFSIFLQPRLRSSSDRHVEKANGNGASGAKDPAYWQREFREAIDEKLEQRILPLLKTTTETQVEISKTLLKTQATLEELVSQRRRSR